MKKEAALVAGASSGIGRELAGQFGAHGSNLVLAARRKNGHSDDANEIRGRFSVRCVEFCTDLSDIGAADAVYEFCRNENIGKVLVNNAWFVANNAFLDLSAGLQMHILQVTVLALTKLTRFFARDG